MGKKPTAAQIRRKQCQAWAETVSRHVEGILDALSVEPHRLSLEFGPDANNLAARIKDADQLTSIYFAVPIDSHLNQRISISYERIFPYELSSHESMEYMGNIGLSISALARKIGFTSHIVPNVPVSCTRRSLLSVSGSYAKENLPYVIELLKAADSSVTLYSLNPVSLTSKLGKSDSP